ncbi:VOC family protein [Pseudoglutamicibacter cumminsii]|uniref:VOC family protein n=1 Tax=Pseudoglutamicibacter cumminsii TaxID=156979 RepID=UPI0026EF1F94|nr:VOC family protein [Pseudoglutamicibacter cumminsii]
MHHIEIYVSDIARSREFYSWLLEGLGFFLYQEWEEGFSYKKEKTYLVFVQARNKYVVNGYNRCNIGLNHLAFSCTDPEEIDLLREKLLSKGVTLLYDDEYPHAGGGESYAVYFEDPDRIKLEVALAD